MHAAGYVSDADLATLYHAAQAVIMPSRYEGFGLPVAEAMADANDSTLRTISVGAAGLATKAPPTGLGRPEAS